MFVSLKMQNILYCEVADGIHAYGVASHRHAPVSRLTHSLCYTVYATHAKCFVNRANAVLDKTQHNARQTHPQMD